MPRLTAAVVSVARDEAGSEVMEYAMIAGLISVVAIGVVLAVGQKVLARWVGVNSGM